MSATVPAGLDVETLELTLEPMEFGKVRGRLNGDRTIELAGGVDADALAPIRAAMGS